MSLRVTEFLANPGRRFPIETTLKGGQEPESLCTVDSIELAGETYYDLGMSYEQYLADEDRLARVAASHA